MTFIGDQESATLGDILEQALARREEDSKRRCVSLAARYDALIHELDKSNRAWYLAYSEGYAIAKLVIMDPDRWQTEILVRKRDLVAQYIIPTLDAALRIGYVSHGVEDFWEPK